MSDALIWGLAILGVVFAAFLVVLFRDPSVAREFITGIVELDLSITGIKIRRAVRTAGQAVVQKEHTQPDEGTLRERFADISPSSRVLWVDDNPENNRLEIQALQRLGLDVNTVRSNAEAESAVRREKYDLIISDIGRAAPESPKAGLELPGRLASISEERPPILYYTGRAVSPRTADGYPVTDRPSELFDLVRRAIPRARGRR